MTATLSAAEMEKRIQQLERQAEKYRSLFGLAPVGFFRMNTAGGEFLTGNAAMAHMLGYGGMPELLAAGRGLGDFIAPRQYSDLLARISAQGMLDHREIELRPAEGVSVQVVLFAVLDPQQQDMAGLMIDISERKRAESVLRESEERLRFLIEHTPAPIAMCDLQMRYIAYSRRWITDYKLPEGNHIGKCHYEVFQTVPEQWTQEHQRCFAGEVIDHEEEPFPRADGSLDWVRRKVYPWREKNGRIGGLIMLTEVITEQKNIRTALRESESKYRKLVENATEAIFIAQDEKIKFPNRIALKMLGLDVAALEELPFLEFVHPEDQNRVIDIHRRRLDGDKALPPTYAFRVINRQGVEYEVELNAVAIEWEGRPATLNFVRDITEQRRLERSLRQAQKMDAIGTLAGGIAHDFNNLLMGIQGHTSLMLTDSDPSHPFYVHLKGIEEYVKSAADLTRQLLGFARGGKYEAKPVDLNDLIDKSAQLFGRTKKEIVIHKKLQPGLWTVVADRQQIEQVLINIYVNAWQAMPAGGQLYLQTDNVLLDGSYVKPFLIQQGNYVKISITDTGIGMDETIKQKIFEPFFTTKEVGRGTGLGLASAYGIIKNHHGLINVYSEKHKGTTFTIYLPASTQAPVQEKTMASAYRTGSETILLVDDEEIILEVGRQMLTKLGYTSHTAGSGQKALQLYRTHAEKFDLVILDMIMPDMNGGQTFDLLKKINPQVKVLLSSGYSINGEASEILKRGCTGFIQKPFNLLELSQKIREVLGAPPG